MSQPVPRAGSPVAAILVAIYMMVLSIVTLCPSIAIIGCGGALGGLTGTARSFSDVYGRYYGSTSGSQSASAGFLAADVASGLITLLGILGLALTVALVVVAIALLAAKSWAWMGTIVLNTIYIGLQLVGGAIGGNLNTIQIIFIVLSGGCIFYLLTSQEIRATFGRA
jgi:hypothetical protein